MPRPGSDETQNLRMASVERPGHRLTGVGGGRGPSTDPARSRHHALMDVEIGVLLLLGLAMAVGLVGIVVPVVPGLLLVAAVAVTWAVLEGGPGAWVVVAVMLVVLALGTIAKYVLPGRTLKEAGAPWSTLGLGAVGAIVGFFVIPVVGLLVGGVLGVWLGELHRLRDGRAAWRSSWATLKAIGIGLLLELAAGLVAVMIWVAGVLLLRA